MKRLVRISASNEALISLPETIRPRNPVGAVVNLHSRNAASRTPGVVDPQLEQKLYGKCAPQIVARWALRRGVLISDAAEVLLGVERALGSAMLIATVNPEPVILAGDSAPKGEATVTAQLAADVPAVTQSLLEFGAAIKPLGGQKKEVAVSILPKYAWVVDGREIANDEKESLKDMSGALADYSRSIQINPDYAMS